MNISMVMNFPNENLFGKVKFLSRTFFMASESIGYVGIYVCMLHMHRLDSWFCNYVCY